MNQLPQALKALLTPTRLELLTQPLFAAEFVDEVMDLAAKHSRTKGHVERATSRALRF